MDGLAHTPSRRVYKTGMQYLPRIKKSNGHIRASAIRSWISRETAKILRTAQYLLAVERKYSIRRLEC